MIGVEVEKFLVDAGWEMSSLSDGTVEFKKKIGGFEESGTLSDGTRVVTLSLCPRYRYLGRVDGWGFVAKDLDLREEASAEVAIKKVMEN